MWSGGKSRGGESGGKNGRQGNIRNAFFLLSLWRVSWGMCLIDSGAKWLRATKRQSDQTCTGNCSLQCMERQWFVSISIEE